MTPAQRAQNEWFRQANWAYKYMDAKMQAEFARAVHRTSLYPRDLFTIMASGGLFALRDEEKRLMFPMATIQAVSASLDAITQLPGYTLRRGTQFWEGVPFGGGGGGGFVGGCKCSINADVTANFTSGAIVDWNGANTFDTDGFHDPAVDADKIFPRPLDEWVSLTANILMDNFGSQDGLDVIILQNGSTIGRGRFSTTTEGYTYGNVSSGPVKIIDPATDYFQCRIVAFGDTSTRLRTDTATFFSYQVLGRTS